MSNQNRGIFEFEVDGEKYVYQLNTNAIVAAEETLGVTIQDLGKKVGMKELRVILWAGLSEFRENITLRDAGKIIDRLGYLKCMDMFRKSIELTFSQEEPDKGKGKGKPKGEGAEAEKNAQGDPATSPS